VGGDFMKVIEGKTEGDVEELNYILRRKSRLKLCSSLFQWEGDVQIGPR
jgi:hypothetical protein